MRHQSASGFCRGREILGVLYMYISGFFSRYLFQLAVKLGLYLIMDAMSMCSSSEQICSSLMHHKQLI
jgi:hypothetical protein